MLNRLQRLLAHPIFEDEEKTRIAQFMTTFSWIAISVLLLLLLSRFFGQTDQTIIPMLTITAMIVIVYIVQQTIIRGYVLAASLLVVFGLWSALTYLAWRADGIRDVAVLGYVIIVLLASFLLGWKSILTVEIISLMSFWILAIAEQQGRHPLHIDDPISYARDLSGLFILISTLIYLLVSGWQRTLQAARVELTERLRAEEKLQIQARYLTALHETTLGLVNRLELNPLLESILTQASELLETPHVCLDLVLPDETALKQELGYGHFQSRTGNTVEKGQGLTGQVWETGETIVAQNYAEWAGRISIAENAGISAAIGVPLKTGEKIVGTLVVAETDKTRIFNAEQVKLLERIAALASLAIDNAILYEQAQKEINERIMIEQDLRSSDERFRKVFNNNNVAISIATLDEGIFLEANNAFWQVSGLLPQTALGHSVLEFDMWQNPEDRAAFVQELIEKGSLQNIEVNFKVKNQPDKTSLAYYEIINIKDQPCILSLFYDITAQRQTEIALRESESRMSAIFSAIPDMIFEINKDGILTGFIASSEIQPLMPPEDFLGRNIKELFPVSISLQTMFAIERALATNQLHAFEYGMPPGEEVQFFEARVAAISAEAAIIMVRDISQRKWVETDRENLIQELEDKNAELERFTYTVSHDLKSPLITIKGFLGFLEQDAGKGDLTRFKSDVKRISDAAEKMQTLLNELLELSRVGRLMNVFEYVSIEELAYEAVELVQSRIHSANITVTIQPEMPVVYGDRKRLTEVIQNIVDNAAKFTGSQPTPKIEIGQEGLLDGKPIFFIRDNGMGIEPAHLDRIFGLFNKLDASSDGTGIGLTIVKRIIEVHNGRIWVQSEAGKGSTFYFTLQTGPRS